MVEGVCCVVGGERSVRAHDPRRAGLALLALSLACSLAASCARPPASEVLSPGSLTVRIGPIDPVALDAAVKSASRTLPMRTEQLVDALWQAGCLGSAVETPLPYVSDRPDVVCALAGRTQHRIVVVAHLDGEERERDVPWHWSGVALLPFLYRTLAASPREHTVVFAAFGKSPQRTTRDYLARLGSPHGDDVRAIIDLQDVDSPAIWFSSSDAGLRRDFVAASLSVGRPLESLRAFSPAHDEGRAGVSMLTIAAEPPGRARRRPSQAEGASESAATGLHATARFVAVFLAYVDETLRLRAESVVPAAPADSEAR